MDKGIIIHSVIYDQEGRVLVLKRSEANDVLPGFWDIPGGTLEDGEDPAEGATRETEEETGLAITAPKLFFYHSKVDKTKNKQFVTLVFAAEYAGGEIKLNPEEHDDHAWITPEEATQYKTVAYLEECLQEAKQRKFILS